MKFIRENWQKMGLIIYTFLIPVLFVYADPSTCDPKSGVICNPISGNGSLPDFIQTILTGLLKIGIPVVALAVIYSGFLFVFARGNSEKLTKAKDTLLYTLIGAAVLLGSWAIASMISATVTGLSS